VQFVVDSSSVERQLDDEEEPVQGANTVSTAISLTSHRASATMLTAPSMIAIRASQKETYGAFPP
jgi:hypothetical protein